MKQKLFIIGLALASIGQIPAAVTLQMSSTTNYLTNFLNSAGQNNTTLAWGIVVDAAGNGFQGGTDPTNPYMPFGNIAANSNGIVLSSLNNGLGDDVLYISGNLMNLTSDTIDGATVGINRVTNINSILYNNGVSTGDPYKVIWFDVTNLSSTSSTGMRYGTFSLPATVLPSPWNGPANTLPADPGTYSAAAASAGADPAKCMGFTLGQAIPEPSQLLLTVFGFLGLSWRKRRT